MTTSLFAFSFSPKKFFKGLVKDLGKSLKIMVPYVIDEVVIKRVKNSPQVRGALLVSKFVLPKKYENQLNRAMKELSVKKVLSPGGSKGDNIDMADLIKIMVRENVIFSQVTEDYKKDLYKQQVDFKVAEITKDIAIKIYSIANKKIMKASVKLPIYKKSQLTIRLYSYKTRSFPKAWNIKTSSKGNASIMFDLNSSMLKRYGKKFRLDVEDYKKTASKAKKTKIHLGTTIMIPRNLPTYTVKIKTGTAKKAGTNSRVWLSLYGSNGRELIDYRLDDQYDNFEKGRLDVFDIKAYNLNNIKSIRLRHDGTKAKSEWYPEWVEIKENKAPYRKWKYSIKKWLDAKNGRRFTSGALKEAKYNIITSTGVLKNAGTDAQILITAFGENGQSFGPVKLNPKKKDMEKGFADSYEILEKNIGKIHKIKIKITNMNNGKGAGWFVDFVSITNKTTKQKSVFPLNRWLSKDHNLSATVNYAKSTARYSITVITGRKKKAGTDSKVFIELMLANKLLKKIELDTKGDNFEKGRSDTFFHLMEKYKKITGIYLMSDGSKKNAEWYPETVLVNDGRKRFLFNCNNWLNKKNRYRLYCPLKK